LSKKVFNIGLLLLLTSVSYICNSCRIVEDKRLEISLNGSWEIAKTDTISGIPDRFSAKVPVPGLVDMADPAIDEQDTSYENSIYWYKRKFTLDRENTELARLKINKAKYHTRVYLNGEYVGENVYNFTPSQFNITPYLNSPGEDNELVIGVGCKNNLPDTVVHGADWEKIRYIPGIYDDVRIILSGYPFISNVQAVPDPENSRLRIVAEIEAAENKQLRELTYTISELSTGKIVANGSSKAEKTFKKSAIADFNVTIPDFKLWSPESPFLYELNLSTSGDSKSTRFGMRTFSTNPDDGTVLLNGKTYYMRGTNVCIGRFFEDDERAGLPWDEQWALELHSKFKDMNWNSVRYCIGFPPERWYEIADSLGFLIQDEYPIWTGWKPSFEKVLSGVTAPRLANEYREWMRERWNHPCVVIWDAQNESVSDTIGPAIQLVRELDLSDRPWDNGWSRPASKKDVTEAHPYIFGGWLDGKYFREGFPSKQGVLKDHLNEKQFNLPDADYDPSIFPNSPLPAPDGIRYNNPIIINEYGWLWLNRDGSPTSLTERIYQVAFPEADTPEKRQEAYAKNLGMLTEYWRIHRTYAGILHFCALGYSRSEVPRGATSDNFIDIKNLVFEPHFYQYVKPAFNPVGLMLEFWDKKLEADSDIKIPVHILNDTYEHVSGTINVRVSRKGMDHEIGEQSISYTLEGLEKKVFSRNVKIPSEPGEYTLEASINYKGEIIKSIREFRVVKG